MLPNPVEIANSYLGGDFSLFPQLPKLILPPVPSACLLTHNAIGSLQTLSILLADDVRDFGWQDALIAALIVGVPELTVRFTLSISHQF